MVAYRSRYLERYGPASRLALPMPSINAKMARRSRKLERRMRTWGPVSEASSMCGIAGYVATPEARADTIERMCLAISHRGPDGGGTYTSEMATLGMRRLAIIDLAGGQQPVHNEDQSVWLVFNGEIYNYVDLRDELTHRGHSFYTESDTETIAHAYEEYGLDCVSHLWGMFALALWDQRRQQLLLARDRLGKKPLLYAMTGRGLVFASEFQALMAHEAVSRDIDPTAIHHYLTYLYVPAPGTIYKGVGKLLPGHAAVWRADQPQEVRTWPYWTLNYEPKRRLSEGEAVEEFQALFRDAVRRRLLSDVPVGAFLSGGIDSSSVVATMADLSTEPVRTFSIGFGEQDFSELAYARLVAERFGTDHQEHVVEPRALEVLPKLVRHYGEPYGDSSAIPTYYVSSVASDQVKVVLNGDGGDELFAGYERHWAAVMAARYDGLPAWGRQSVVPWLRQWLPAPVGSRSLLARTRRFLNALDLPPADRYLRWVGAFSEEAKAELYTPDFAEQVRHASTSPALTANVLSDGAREYLDQFLLADTLLYLPNDLLVKVDIASMACSLEARSPFLDHRLVEFAASLPCSLKLRRGVSKFLLKRAMRGVLPDRILHRRKMGFGVPVGRWLRGELRPLLEETLFSPRALSRGYFRPEAVRQLVDRHVLGVRDETPWIWGLLMLELWHQIVREGEGPEISGDGACDAGVFRNAVGSGSG